MEAFSKASKFDLRLLYDLMPEQTYRSRTKVSSRTHVSRLFGRLLSFLNTDGRLKGKLLGIAFVLARLVVESRPNKL